MDSPSQLAQPASHIAAGRTMLYVEDHPAQATATRALFERGGWQVDHVTSGDEAAELFDPARHAVVVTDHVHPGVAGIDLRPVLGEANVVVLSAFAAELAGRALLNGAMAVVRKGGVDDSELLALVDEVAGGGRPGRRDPDAVDAGSSPKPEGGELEARSVWKPKPRPAVPHLAPGAPRILLVEDTPIMADAIRDRLTHGGWQVDHVTSGDDALASYDPARHAVVVTDHNHPGIRGAELAGALTRLHSEARVVLLSAFAASVGEAAIANGAAAVVNKAGGSNELLGVLDEVVRNR